VEGGVNYYPHHIGDYVSATAHLSWTEDCAYRRLLDAYYTREVPLPADVAACCRLVRALSKDERTAVGVVLHEFFALTDEGWRHGRCDEEIGKASAKRAKAAESANKRWQPKSKPPGDANAHANDMPTHMRTHSEGNAPNPNPNPNTKLASLAASAPAPEPSPAVRLAIEARQHGLQVTGSDPRLIAAAEQGVTPETLRDVIAECARRKGSPPPIGYVLATLQGWAADAGRLSVVGAAAPARGGVTDADIARLQAKLEAEAQGATDAAA
jgi:Uncharacterized protein conserved in bacteria